VNYGTGKYKSLPASSLAFHIFVNLQTHIIRWHIVSYAKGFVTVGSFCIYRVWYILKFDFLMKTEVDLQSIILYILNCTPVFTKHRSETPRSGAYDLLSPGLKAGIFSVCR
jgi:hypothetical protein